MAVIARSRGSVGPGTLRVLLRLSRYGLNHKRYMAGAFLALSGASATAMFIPRFLGLAIDRTVENGLERDLLVIAGAILAVSVLRGIFGYGQNYLSEAVAEKAAYDLRNDFFRKLQGLSFGFHDRQQTGNLMSRATADVEVVRRFISLGMVRGLSVVLMIAAVAGLMLATNWRLGLVSLAFVPPILWRAFIMSRGLRKTWYEVQAETGHMTTVLQESLAGIKAVKAFGAGGHMSARFQEKASILRDLTYSALRVFASQGSLMTLIFTSATGAILWFGGREIAAGRLTPGELASFILYIGLLTMPVRMVGWLVNTISRAASAGQRLYEVLDAESPVRDRPEARAMPRSRGGVSLEDVSLSYEPGRVPAVHNVDLEVEPGQVVAILGAPGSGKSTIAHLIPRFYDPTEGKVSIDGVDIRDYTLASLRNNIGIVLQDVFVFTASIRGTRRFPGRRRARRQSRQSPRLHSGAAERLRHLGGRARGHAVGRPTSASGHCQDHPARPAHTDPRRLDLQRRYRHRVHDPAGARGGGEGEDDVRDSAPALHREASGPDTGPGGRRDSGARRPR